MPVIYNKKVEYAYTDPGVKAHTLSWAEYQALSEDDKMNGDLYFIPDKQPEGNPSRIWTKLGTDPLTTQADDVSGAVNELNSRLVNTRLTYNSSGYFPLNSGDTPPHDGWQITIVTRNRTNGAIYALWYDRSITGFRVGTVISGSNPSAGHTVEIQYIS